MDNQNSAGPALHMPYTLSELAEAARLVLKKAGSKIIAFYAPMGAGKTTMIKAMLNELGAADAGSSPTFGIVNEYYDCEGVLLAYHFDFYRLNDESEALDLGLEDYLSQDVWIFIEWPEKISSLLPSDTTRLNIKIVQGQTREIYS